MRRLTLACARTWFAHLALQSFQVPLLLLRFVLVVLPILPVKFDGASQVVVYNSTTHRSATRSLSRSPGLMREACRVASDATDSLLIVSLRSSMSCARWPQLACQPMRAADAAGSSTLCQPRGVQERSSEYFLALQGTLCGFSTPNPKSYTSADHSSRPTAAQQTPVASSPKIAVQLSTLNPTLVLTTAADACSNKPNTA